VRCGFAGKGLWQRLKRRCAGPVRKGIIPVRPPVCAGGRVRDRATVIQKKTGRLVQFEITEQARTAISEWLSELPGEAVGAFFRAAPGTAAFVDTPVRPHRSSMGALFDRRSREWPVSAPNCLGCRAGGMAEVARKRTYPEHSYKPELGGSGLAAAEPSTVRRRLSFIALAGAAYANLRAGMGGDWFGVPGRPVPGSNAWSRGARCSPPVSRELKNIAAGSNTEQHG